MRESLIALQLHLSPCSSLFIHPELDHSLNGQALSPQPTSLTLYPQKTASPMRATMMSFMFVVEFLWLRPILGLF
jgi:hypothetical protein